MMGADLAIITLYSYKDLEQFPEKERGSRMLEALDKCFESFNEDEWIEFIEQNELNDLSEMVSELGDVDKESLYKYVKETIDDFVNCLTGREVSHWFDREICVFVTGGMSWGDDPTDAFDLFNRIFDLPQSILDAGGFMTRRPRAEDILLTCYGDSLGESLKSELKAWILLRQLSKEDC